MAEATIRLKVNGTEYLIEQPQDTLLLDVLRGPLRITGSRFGCGQEQCGACMVLVDGQPAFACTRTIDTLDGAAVTTVEGVAPDDSLIAALVKNQAAQCGFCLPGIVISAKALLASNPAPDRGAVLDALQPHLCRCGAHVRIVDAILSVAAT